MTPRWLHWPAASAAFAPNDLSNLVVWLDADDTAFNNLDAVDAWTNKGSGGNTAQSDSTKRPIFKTSLLNGKPGVDFDGTNDCLQIPSLALDTLISVFLVAKNTTSKTFYIEHGPTWAQPNSFYFYGTSNGHYGVRRSNVQNSYFGTTGWFGSLAAQAGLVIDTISSTPNPMGSVYKDGVLQSNGSTVAGAGNSVTNSSHTDTLNIGARNNGAVVPMDGDLHELIIYNAPLSQANREKVEGYLAHKWGLTGSLPSTHPYKATAP